MNETAQNILGYIKRLPETWEGQLLRQRALDNFDEKYASNISCSNPYLAISGAFYWTYSKEGYEYWNNINRLLLNGTIQLLPEENKEVFVWTDELVAEFTSWSLSKSPTMQGRYADIEQFKASKQRKPLFTTEDGKEIFEGDKYYSVEVFNNSFEVTKLVASLASIKVKEFKDFSTEAAALEYVRLNKPTYSLNDVEIASKKIGSNPDEIFSLKIELEKLKP